MGAPLFKVRVRSDKPVAKLCARLTEVMPDGRSNFVSYAILNLTHRDSDEKPSPLVPARDYDIALAGHFACYRFAPGSRIRVALSETWWPDVWPSPQIVTLHLTAGISSLELPVRPTKDGEAPPFDLFANRYDVPGAQAAPYAEPLAGVQISGEPGSRTFLLVEGSLDPADHRHIAGVGTSFREAYRMRRLITENQPNSAEMEAEAINVIERGDWRIKLRARCSCRSTPTHFVCTELFEAWEGDRKVFFRDWSQDIPRELV
jgi:hypothetical protein